MSVRVCSLIAPGPQTIPAGPDYHLLRFPYAGESYDAYGMHQPQQPDGGSSTWPDERSGLIWPTLNGWGSLTALIFWEDGGYTEVRDRFVRDPLTLSTGFDSTATEDHPRTPGGQYRGKHHEMFVHPGTPIGLMVRHNAPSPVRVTFAEFKLAIHHLG